MRNRRKGSALLLALILGSVLLLGLAALIGTALSESRGATRSALNSAAFFLAESGIDRTTSVVLGTAAGDSFESADSVWTKKSNGTYTRTFAADSAALGGPTGNNKVVVRKTVGSSTTTYTIASRGWVQNAGAAIVAQRAIEVTYERTTKNAANVAAGCLSLTGFLAASTASSSISASQVGPAFDSYSSANNAAPSAYNRDNKCLVGTSSAANGDLNLGNGNYYSQVGTGSTAANKTPTVGYATDASPPHDILAKIDNPKDDRKEAVAYDPSLVRHDIAFTYDPVVPPDASAKDGWTQVLPKDGEAQSQWKSAGKIAEYSPKKNAVTPSVSVGNNTLNAGSSDADKVYIATSSLDNISKINVSGSVILVVLGTINASNGLVVNYKSTSANLTIYAAGDVSGVIKTTQQINTDTVSPNWEAFRLTIGMLPGNHNINMESLEPTAINAHVSTAVKKPTDGGKIIMNFDDNSTFVGSIIAPYSAAQLSATGQKGKLSDYCGSLLAKSISISGSNGFAFHYDEKLGSSATSAPSLVLDSWRQIRPDDPIFD